VTLSLFAAALESPDGVLAAEGPLTLTYRDAAESAARLGHALARRGLLAPRMPLGCVLPPGLDGVELAAGLLSLGVPFFPLHPRWTATERRELLGELPLLPDDVLAEARATRHGTAPAVADDDRVAVVIATSGSSGRPKRALLSRRAVVAAAQASARNLGWLEHDRWLLSLPLAHIGGLSVVTRCLLARRAVVVGPQAPLREGVESFAATIIRDRVTLLSVVPALLERLVALPGFELPAHVRAILCGGGPIPERLLAAARAKAWPVLPTYGMTETCSQVATLPPEECSSSDLAVPPLRGVQARIVNGVIELSGPQLFSGYLGEPGSDPALRGGWFATRDLGELDALGRLSVLGRADEALLSGGVTVQPLEVERALLAHDAVQAACVFGIPDETFGELVAAAVVPRIGVELSRAKLRAHLDGRLAPYKRPRLLAIVHTLSASESGKVLRTVVRTESTPFLEPL
jgi:O-succinylbenzoic acid--CoA ligase